MKCPFSFFKKKKREIQFISRIPHGDHIEPVEESTYEREWIKHSKKNLKKSIKESHPFEPVTALHRCPGIKMLLENTGFVIRAHRDFILEASGDSISFNRAVYTFTDGGTTTFSDINLMTKELSMLLHPPKGAVPLVVKLSTLWTLKAPEDLVFLFLPIPYSDDNRFTVLPGILDPLINVDISVFLWWNVPFKTDTIKKGTPLTFCLPIPRHKVYDSWSMVNDPDPDYFKKVDTQNFFNSISRFSNYEKIAEVSKKLFYGNK